MWPWLSLELMSVRPVLGHVLAWHQWVILPYLCLSFGRHGYSLQNSCSSDCHSPRLFDYYCDVAGGVTCKSIPTLVPRLTKKVTRYMTQTYGNAKNAFTNLIYSVNTRIWLVRSSHGINREQPLSVRTSDHMPFVVLQQGTVFALRAQTVTCSQTNSGHTVWHPHRHG